MSFLFGDSYTSVKHDEDHRSDGKTDLTKPLLCKDEINFESDEDHSLPSFVNNDNEQKNGNNNSNSNSNSNDKERLSFSIFPSLILLGLAIGYTTELTCIVMQTIGYSIYGKQIFLVVESSEYSTRIYLLVLFSAFIAMLQMLIVVKIGFYLVKKTHGDDDDDDENKCNCDKKESFNQHCSSKECQYLFGSFVGVWLEWKIRTQMELFSWESIFLCILSLIIIVTTVGVNSNHHLPRSKSLSTLPIIIKEEATNV